MNNPKSFIYPLSVLTVSFFMFGFMTSINDILTPYLKNIFKLNYTQSSLVQLFFFLAYGITSIPCGVLVSKIGHKNGIILGFAICTLGCLFFIPATLYNIYYIFLIGFFILATGNTLLQVACNPYATLLGDPKTSAKRIVFMQGFNALGKMSAPIIGALFFIGVMSSEKNLAISYGVLAMLMLAMAVGSYRTNLPLITEKDDFTHKVSNNFMSHSHLYLGWIALFACVGSEWSVSSSLVNYLGLSNMGAINPSNAANLIALFWAGELVGRFAGAYLLGKISAPVALLFSGIMAVFLNLIAIKLDGLVAIISVLSLGLCNSIMFPTIFSLATRGLGNWTTKASGILLVAIMGGGLISYFRGIIADYYGLQFSYVVPMMCYCYIIFYAFRGYNKKLSLSYT